MASNDFTIDKQEYQSVFKVFDKDNTGEINIQQVNHYITKFEQVQQGYPPAGSASDHEKQKQGQNSHEFPLGTGDKQHATLGPGGAPNNAASGHYYSKPGRMLQGGGLANGSSNGTAFSKATTKASSTAGTGKFSSPNKRSGGGAGQGQGFHYGAGGSNSKNFQQSNSTSLQLKPTQVDNQNIIGSGIVGSKGESLGGGFHKRKQDEIGLQPGGSGQSHHNNNSRQGEGGAGDGQQVQQPLGSQNNSSTNSEDAAAFNTTNHTQTGTAGSSSQSQSQQQHASGMAPTFPNGKQTLQFEEFIDVIKESCTDTESAENYLVFAFSMFDREKKGYITSEDLKIVFQLLGESVPDEELNTMIKIAGVKSNDKINFKEFVDFFYKVD